MTGRAAMATQADVKRAVEAARKLGLPIRAIEIERGLVRVVTTGDADPVQATGWEDVVAPNGKDQAAVRSRVRPRR